ncbi:MAG: hypothetical protein JWM26_1247 [Betaproteobacteria bacterium]|nr:hypothetical protein [Betaproteobacteria bacterium]
MMRMGRAGYAATEPAGPLSKDEAACAGTPADTYAATTSDVRIGRQPLRRGVPGTIYCAFAFSAASSASLLTVMTPIWLVR